MTDTDAPKYHVGPTPSLNVGYAIGNLLEALTRATQHEDAATRERARTTIAQWESIVEHMASRTADYGSRTPLAGVPAWVTPEVATGGFVTGALLASGPLQMHEEHLLEQLPAVAAGAERSALNAYFLSNSGLADLQDRLHTGRYQVNIPEEAALLVVAWLAQHGHAQPALDLLSSITEYFPRLRFYPVPAAATVRSGARVYVQDVAHTIASLEAMEPNRRVQAQKEAVTIWASFYDRLVALFLETVADHVPEQTFPPDWHARAQAVLDEHAQLSTKHPLCGKSQRPKTHFGQLIELLRRCTTQAGSLPPPLRGRLRVILRCYVAKHGTPHSEQCRQQRERQAQQVAAPLYREVATVVLARLQQQQRNTGLDDISAVTAPISTEEAARSGLPVGWPVPESVAAKVERCLNETVAALIERGLISSGESLARVLPQMVADLRSQGISDPALRQLYAATYRAFRQRRSLLLLNLASQVRLEELPWIRAIEQFRTRDTSQREVDRHALEEVVVLTLTAFPYTILPNKLLQELRALSKGAGLALPLVDELATDIFMGEFSGKFLESANLAAQLLEGSLYATYFGIDYAKVRELAQREAQEDTKRAIRQRHGFADLCVSRAGVPFGRGQPATNGMIIEQQQIVTTQNLAALFVTLDLLPLLSPQLETMAKDCFAWICRWQQMKIDNHHSRLLMLKNTAYAWRQMIFFMSLLDTAHSKEFAAWAESYLAQQGAEFRHRFRPAMRGLALALAGVTPEDHGPLDSGVRRFLGWSTRHWLMPAA